MHFVHQDGQAVFKFAVRKQAELCEKILARNGLKGSDIDTLFPTRRTAESSPQPPTGWD